LEVEWILAWNYGRISIANSMESVKKANKSEEMFILSELKEIEAIYKILNSSLPLIVNIFYLNECLRDSLSSLCWVEMRWDEKNKLRKKANKSGWWKFSKCLLMMKMKCLLNCNWIFIKRTLAKTPEYEIICKLFFHFYNCEKWKMEMKSKRVCKTLNIFLVFFKLYHLKDGGWTSFSINFQLNFSKM
jgi:hypothetical protein